MITVDEGTKLEIVPAEALITGDVIIEGGSRCGIRDVWQVVGSVFGTRAGVDGLMLSLENRDSKDQIVEYAGDELIIRVKQS